MSNLLSPGYQLHPGSGLDRAMLVKFIQRTYEELYPGQDFSHLAETVERYFSQETPLWWVEEAEGQRGRGAGETRSGGEVSYAPCPIPNPKSQIPNRIVACLWLGNAVDQVGGDRYAHIFLLYVTPEHRRRGIGTTLMRHAEDWAKARGDRQIGLQVFATNQPAVNLYHQLGYQTQSLFMVKSLLPKNPLL